MVLLCGVEEAGRGPVLGPLVMCGILIKEEDEPKLKSIGAKDSKLLTPRTREILFEQIKKMVLKYKFAVVSPAEIDGAVGKGKVNNLNLLEARKSAEIINALKPDKVMLDCPSTNIKAYDEYLRRFLRDKKLKLVCAHHADVRFPVVSAASIMAKVTRDAEIKKLKKKVGIDFGSGYPADPVTKDFLKEHYMDFPDIIRHSWAPYKELIAQKKQRILGDFEPKH